LWSKVGLTPIYSVVAIFGLCYYNGVGVRCGLVARRAKVIGLTFQKSKPETVWSRFYKEISRITAKSRKIVLAFNREETQKTLQKIKFNL